MKYQIYKITNLLEPQRVYIGMTSQVCHGKRKKSGGYHWKFVEKQ